MGYTCAKELRGDGRAALIDDRHGYGLSQSGREQCESEGDLHAVGCVDLRSNSRWTSCVTSWIPSGEKTEQLISSYKALKMQNVREADDHEWNVRTHCLAIPFTIFLFPGYSPVCTLRQEQYSI